MESESKCGRSGGFSYHPIAAPTNNRNLRWFKETKRVVTHGFSPSMDQDLNFPLLTLRNHAPSQFSCCKHSWLVYLIKMCVYMMPLLIYVVCLDIPSMTIPNQKHNITKSMVGPWPLAPHQDHLQYMYHIY